MSTQPLKSGPRAGFVLSMVGGIFILIGSLPLFSFALGGDNAFWTGLFLGAIILSVLMMFFALRLRARPAQHVQWGKLLVVSSLPTLIGIAAFVLLVTFRPVTCQGLACALLIFAVIFIVLLPLLILLGSVVGLIGGILGIVWRDVPRPSAGFQLSILAGILMLIPIPFIALWARGMPYYGSAGTIFFVPADTYQGLMAVFSITSPDALTFAGLLGGISAVLLITSTILLYKNPQQSRRYGVLIIIFSTFSIFGMSGFWVGLLLGLLGGALTLRWKLKSQYTASETTASAKTS